MVKEVLAKEVMEKEDTEDTAKKIMAKEPERTMGKAKARERDLKQAKHMEKANESRKAELWH